eukprot:gb/GECG01005189.1/.p1 GENE.gb/GECG01005189.1/~~gb/GECG01005189.1/.p1  ORF type:complete len:124 (+),score=10.17 gb/GECG01005189.1/:1-372(+)
MIGILCRTNIGSTIMEEQIKNKLCEGRKPQSGKQYFYKVRKVVSEVLNDQWGDSFDELVDLLYDKRNEICVWVQVNTADNTIATFFRSVLVASISKPRERNQMLMNTESQPTRKYETGFYPRI